MKKWEYRVRMMDLRLGDEYEKDREQVDEYLNRQGENGWKICEIARVPRTDALLIAMKRKRKS